MVFIYIFSYLYLLDIYNQENLYIYVLIFTAEKKQKKS